jgi:hypothetical protein
MPKTKRRAAPRKKAVAFTGGCLCGSVRFRARGAPMYVSHCHCTMCRVASGAPVVTFAGFPTERVRFTKGKPKFYRSSKIARRALCGKCGSQLYFQFDRHPERMGMNVGCFDHPEKLRPQRHIFTNTMIPWLKMTDGLPREWLGEEKREG